MSAIITKYYEKLQSMELLKEEIKELEKSRDFKKEMAFKAALENLMDENSVDAKHVVKVLEGIDPHLHSKSKSPRKARPVMRYTNPEGESLTTKGGNNKKLKEWKAKWGDEVIEKTKEKVS